MIDLKSKLLKLGCALLAAATLCGSLAACGGESETGTTESTGGGEKETKVVIEAPVPHYNWGERSFKVLCTHNANEPNFEVVAAAESTDYFSVEVYDRNSWLEEYYHVSIEDVGTESDEPLSLLRTVQMSGDHPYDLVFLVRNDMSTAIINGYLTELSNLPYMDLTHEWYNPTTIQSMRIGEKLYHMVSDFSLVDKARINALYLNRDMAKQYGLPDIIQMVRDGKWTLEQMMTCVKPNDLNGDGVMDQNDQWGLTCGGKEMVCAFWNGMENKVVSIDDEGNYSITVSNEHSQTSAEKLRDLFDDSMQFNGGRWNDYALGYQTFLAGRTIFLSESLFTVTDLNADAEFAYSIIPFPKFNEEQKQYYTTNDNTYTSTFGIPTCAAEPDFSAFMVEVLSWRSSTTTFPAYYETVCKVRGSYDEVCAEMLDLVFGSLTFDFGLLYSNNVKLKSKVLMDSIYNKTDIVTLYAEWGPAAETQLENLFTTIDLLD